MVAGRPRDDVAVPAAVAELAAGAELRPEWHNEVGGLTWQILDDRGWFVKWNPHTNEVDLAREIERLAWAGRHATVPVVVASGADDEGVWFASEPLPGCSAVAEEWVAQPGVAVAAIGRGLRRLHDRLPVDDCPFSWRAPERVALAVERRADGRIDAARWSHPPAGVTVDEALDMVKDPPDVDRLVVCHGDACAPNTLIAPDGSPAGHVDLGALGIADRWADIAIATWSTEWNYGPGWEEPLLEAYGVEPDPARTAYYRLLWDLGP